MHHRVLIVEDEVQIADVLVLYLEKHGFGTARATSVREAIRLHAQLQPALVLLDIGLPGGDGFDVLTAIRRRDDTPVIIATAYDDDATRLSGLRVGADDYVVKPFKWLEVVERVRAVLRRTHGTFMRRVLSVGPLVIDLEARLATVGADGQAGAGTMLRLTPSEFALLAHMARFPSRAFTRAELLEVVASERYVFDRVVDSHLSKARAKLAVAGYPDMIQPVRGVGYRLWPVA